MQDSIYTIPVSEVFDPKCGCPICDMRNMLENRCIEYIMGAAMMEPDVRIETNKTGFCKEHFDKMLKARNRLSLALMLESHLAEVREKIMDAKSLNNLLDKSSKAKKVSKINNSCYVCDKIDWAMERMLGTIYRLYENERSFRDLFASQEFLCLPHYELLCTQAAGHMNKKYLNDFIKTATALTANYLETLNADVSQFCKMFDYRNSGEDADWGNSKDSIERAIAFLTSREP